MGDLRWRSPEDDPDWPFSKLDNDNPLPDEVKAPDYEEETAGGIFTNTVIVVVCVLLSLFTIFIAILLIKGIGWALSL